MIRWTTQKAVMAGIIVLLLAQVMYVGVLLKISHHELLRLILLSSPCFAAFATAYLAPRRKILVGISTAIYGTAIAMLSAYTYESLGFYVDQIGGLLATFAILFAYHAALSIVGSIAGYFLSKPA